MKGWHLGIDDNNYHHEAPGVSSSGLKTFLNRTGAHFKYNKENPPDDKPIFALGKLVHALALEPATVGNSFVVAPKFTGTGARSKKADFEAEHAGKTLIKPDDWDLGHAMRDALMANDDAALLLSDCYAESSIFWQDNITGELCKVRPDALPRNNLPFCVDLKTTLDASAEAFARSVHQFNYHLSAAMYLDGILQTPEIAQALGYEVTDFIFVCVEKEPPHLTAVYQLDGEALALGQTKYRHALRLYAESKANGFPGYPAGIRNLTLPPWAFKTNEV